MSLAVSFIEVYM